MNLDEELAALSGNPYATPQALLAPPVEATQAPAVLPFQMSLVAQGIKALLVGSGFGLFSSLAAGGLAGWLKSMPSDNGNLADRMVIAAILIMFPPILALISDCFQIVGNWRCSLTSQRHAVFPAKLAFVLAVPILICHLVSLIMNVMALNTMQRPSNLPVMLELVAAGFGVIALVASIVYWKRTTAYLGEAAPIKSCRRMILLGLSFFVAAPCSYALYWMLNEAWINKTVAAIVMISVGGIVILLFVLFIVYYFMCLVQTRRAILRRMTTIEDVRQSLKARPLQ